MSRPSMGMLVLLVLSGLMAAVAAAQIPGVDFTYDMQSGGIPGHSSSSMQTPPQMRSDPDGNRYLRMTGTPGDCDSIPGCPPGVRATRWMSLHFASMPLFTATNRHRSYTLRIRFVSGGTANKGRVWETFHADSVSGESVGGDGQGPSMRMWRVDHNTIQFISNYNNETQQQTANVTGIGNDQWHTVALHVNWQHNSTGTAEFYLNGTRRLNISGRPTVLGPLSNRLPGFKLGLYDRLNDISGSIDFDDVQNYDTDVGPVGGGGTPPTPAPTVKYFSPTGSGTACTAAAPCAATTINANHSGGDTIRLLSGTYTNSFDNILKSGTANAPTILESASISGTPITVGARGVPVHPGLATISLDTGMLRVASGRHHITVRHLNVTTTGPGTNPAIQINDPSATPMSDILLENLDVQAPTRTGRAGIRIYGSLSGGRGEPGGNTSKSQILKSRIHHVGCLPAPNTTPAAMHGISLVGLDQILEDNDIYDNCGMGIEALSSTTVPTDRMQIRHNRVFGNGSAGIEADDGSDHQIHHNLIYANGHDGLILHPALRRAMIYHNSLYANGLGTVGSQRGLRLHAGVTGVVRNNISLGHPQQELEIPNPAASVACSDNLSSDASESLAPTCTATTFNAVATEVWQDPTHPVLASRNFALKSGSVAIDNGTPPICSAADNTANRCNPVLILADFISVAPDQGAKESATISPSQQQLVTSYSFDNCGGADTTCEDATSLLQHGTATSITADLTNRIEGTQAASYDANTDRISTPMKHIALSQGFSVGISARASALGTMDYVFGHAVAGSHFIHVKKSDASLLVLGLGSTLTALTTTFLWEADVWYRIVLTLTPGSLSGTGTARVWVDNLQVGEATYLGLTQLNTVADLGNNGGNHNQGWVGQLDAFRLWNYPLAPPEIAADCTAFCRQTPPPPPDEVIIFENLTIGTIGANVLSGDILQGSSPTLCSPLSDWQVTCGGVAQVETACVITGSSPAQVRLTLAASCQAADEVLFFYRTTDPAGAQAVRNVINHPCTPLVFAGPGTTDPSGILVSVPLQGTPCATECQTLANFLLRDACVPVPIHACAVNLAQGSRQLQLTRPAAPVSGTVPINLIFLPSDQKVSITNAFTPGSTEEPPLLTGLAQTQWRFRAGGPDSVPFDGLPNGQGDISASGTVHIRLALANLSGAQVTNLGTSLWCAQQAVGANFGAFVRINGGLDASAYNSIGLRYAPSEPNAIADNAQLASAALPLGGGLSVGGISRFRRHETVAARHTLAPNEQVEEEHALELRAEMPLGTRFVCRLQDESNVAFPTYAGLAGCTPGDGPFTAGEHPCGAPLTVGPARRR